MLTIYKNFFYSDDTAFRETEPNNQILPSEHYLLVQPTNLKIEQLRFGLDYYYTQSIDVNINLKTFNDLNVSTNDNNEDANIIWLTISLPNNRHIDWILHQNKIHLEYFIEGYGYTNYLFQTIYKGKPEHTHKIKSNIIKSINSNDIWIYNCNSNQSIEKYVIINNIATEFIQIFEYSNQLFNSLNAIDIQFGNNTKLIHSHISESKIIEQINLIIQQILSVQLPEHPIFDSIHKIQCEVHQTDTMFKLKKLWEK